jgi:hypothetical protein
LQSATILGGLAKQQHGTKMTEHERVLRRLALAATFNTVSLCERLLVPKLT